MALLKNPWQRQAETIYRAADQLAGELAKLPILQPLDTRQQSDLFYESLYYLNLLCDNFLVEDLSERRSGDDLEARMRLTMYNVGDRIEKLILSRIGLSPQSPGYQEWVNAHYAAMKERRGRYGELDPKDVMAEFGRTVLRALGKTADEVGPIMLRSMGEAADTENPDKLNLAYDGAALKIAGISLQVMRDRDLIGATKRLGRIAG